MIEALAFVLTGLPTDHDAMVIKDFCSTFGYDLRAVVGRLRTRLLVSGMRH
jgi:hypothetical protein